MVEEAFNKREFFRVDTVLPLSINVVSPVMRSGLVSRLVRETNLKTALANISGGYISFRTLRQYNIGDILEMTMTLTVPDEITVCVYGEVVRASRTRKNHHRTVAMFINMEEKIRELIMHYIFHLERTALIKTEDSQQAAFTPVPLSSLVSGTMLPFEIFKKEADGIKYLFGAGLPYDEMTREFLEEEGISRVFVTNEDVPLLNNYIQRFRARQRSFDREDAMSFKDYLFDKGHYYAIDRAVLLPHTEIEFSLFTMNNYLFDRGVQAVPEQPVTVDENISGLKGSLFVKRTDLSLYRTYLNSLQPPPQKTEALRLKALVLKEHVKIIMQELFADASNKGNLLEAVGIADRVVECLRLHPDSVYTLVSLDCEDFYVYIHSVNVAVLAVSVGLALKMEYDSVVRLCIGALLHDIGHSAINEEIVNKQGRLTKYEYEVFKTHVIEGIKILRLHPEVPPESLAAVLHHHEKLNGSGYPSGLSGRKISLFGRITAIADAYDILTPNRPYSERRTPFNALSLIKKDSAYYDPEILRAFIKILAKVK